MSLWLVRPNCISTRPLPCATSWKFFTLACVTRPPKSRHQHWYASCQRGALLRSCESARRSVRQGRKQHARVAAATQRGREHAPAQSRRARLRAAAARSGAPSRASAHMRVLAARMRSGGARDWRLKAKLLAMRHCWAMRNGAFGQRVCPLAAGRGADVSVRSSWSVPPTCASPGRQRGARTAAAGRGAPAHAVRAHVSARGAPGSHAAASSTNAQLARRS